MIQHYKSLFILLCLILPLGLSAQVESILNGIQLNQSVQTVTKKLAHTAGSVNVITIETPTFPLAKEKETHLVCSQLLTQNGTINKVVFTFADDTLKYIEARGNAVKVLTQNRKDTARTYLDYEVYVAENLFLKKAADAAWILTPEAMHVNLFTWENPYLDSGNKENTNKIGATQIPPFIKMGATLDEIKPVLEAHSAFTNTEELDGSDPNAQLQINCFGVEYLGFPRKLEARFGNNTLNVVWILTGKGEEDRIRQALIAAYGAPVFENAEWEIYNDWQVGLRKDKPEVLLMEKSIGLGYKTNYFKQ